MLKVNILIIIFSLSFFRCKTSNNTDKNELFTDSKFSECQSGPLGKISSNGPTAEVIFVEKDTLAIKLTDVFACDAQLDEISSIENDSTLKLAYISKGNSGSACACWKNVIIGVSSLNHDLNGIKQLNYGGYICKLE